MLCDVNLCVQVCLRPLRLHLAIEEKFRPRLHGSEQISARTKTCTVPACVYTRPAELDEFLNGQGPFQTPLHSCAEPNSIRLDFGATLERRLIQTTYLRLTLFGKVTVINFRWEYMRSEFTGELKQRRRRRRRRRGRRQVKNEFGHFTLLFCRGRQRNVQRIITHVQSYCPAHKLPSNSVQTTIEYYPMMHLV